MDKEWVSWDQVKTEYQLSRDDLVDYCTCMKIPLYNANKIRVYPVGYHPSLCQQPRIIWGRIHLAENEVLTFHGQTEFSRIIFKGYPETGDFFNFPKRLCSHSA